MEKKFVSAIVYLHNNESMVKEFFDRVITVITESFSQYEIILVDDECEDNSLTIAENCIKQGNYHKMVTVVHMGFYQGLEAAMNAGRDISIGDFVYEFDTVNVDYNPELIMEVYKRTCDGFDIVSASSNRKGRLSSRIFYKTYNAFSRGDYSISSESFRIVSRRAINRIKSLGQYIPYRKAVYANCGLKMDRISYVSKNNNERFSRSTLEGNRIGLALDSFIYFTNALEKLSAVISVVFLLFSLFMMFYIIIDHFVEKNIVEGWTSTMMFMSFGFFGVFSLLTIIIKYISVLLNLEFKSQKYIVSGIDKLGD